MQGWQGVQTIPRVVTYDAKLNELVFYPIVEAEQLRRELLYKSSVTLNQVGLQACLHPFDACSMCLVFSQALLAQHDAEECHAIQEREHTTERWLCFVLTTHGVEMT